MREGLRARGVGLMLAWAWCAAAWAHPAKGTAAPALDTLKLLQAGPGAKADWASLKGKVVVLEFWATWCSPCIASLPHLNEMVAALDPGRFQFINVDDEDATAVRTFLTRKKMAGWVGVDASGEVFKRYGVEARPTTIIIDGSGKVVAATEIDAVNVDQLRAVAAGKEVAFKPAMEITETSGAGASAGTSAAGDALFAVAVSRAAAEEKTSLAKHAPTGTDFLGQDADGIFTAAFDVFREPYVLKDALPAGRYDLRVIKSGGGAGDAAVQQAVLAALHLRLDARTVTKPAYVLRAMDAAKGLLNPSASARGVKRGCWRGKCLLMNGTMNDMAYVLGSMLEIAVVNETRIEGKYDARFEAPEDFEGLNAVLRKTFGLELVPGGQAMPLTVFEVKKQ